jgi:hypothetical protein
MRPATAGVRFYTREEDICCSKPIDWDGDEDGEKSGRESLVNSIRTLKLLRPTSAPLSIRLASTAQPPPLSNAASTSASASQDQERSVMLDELTRGYKGMVTQEQLARCPTPRLNLFASPQIMAVQRAVARPTTAGTSPHPHTSALLRMQKHYLRARCSRACILIGRVPQVRCEERALNSYPRVCLLFYDASCALSNVCSAHPTDT